MSSEYADDEFSDGDPFGTSAQRANFRRSSRTRPLSQVEIEIAIAQIVEDLETTTEEYAQLADAEAIAESIYKDKLHTALVHWAASDTVLANGKRPPVSWCDAQANLTAKNEARTYRLAAAVLRACRESLTTKRARLDALRTLNANVREQVR